MSEPANSLSSMRTAVQRVVVTTKNDGSPETVIHEGRQWHVDAEPLRWFERTRWWEEVSRMPRGAGIIDREIWRVQARLGRNPKSELSTLELEKDRAGGGWLLRAAA